MSKKHAITDLASLRVWLVHDWLTGWRGGEKILLELVRMFPKARIATLIHVPGTTHPELDARVAQSSFLQKIPGAASHYRHLLPLFPRAARSLKLDGDCDLVLSVSHAVAKGVLPPPGVPHICYCNSPMRYIWGMEDQYLSRLSFQRLALKTASPRLRRFDLDNRHVSLFLGNSQNIAQRIRRCYNRAAIVVSPGIDHTYFTLDPQTPRENFFLCAGALVGYKRIDLAVETFRNWTQHSRFSTPAPSLIIIGTGPEYARLRRLAGDVPHITFLGHRSDEVLRSHYQRCRAFLFPGEEDFGFTPIEAQACGAPVIAYQAGGALETVVPYKPGGALEAVVAYLNGGAPQVPPPPVPTGIFFPEQTPASLAAAINQMESLHPQFHPESLRANAQRFTWEAFRTGLSQVITRVLNNA